MFRLILPLPQAQPLRGKSEQHKSSLKNFLFFMDGGEMELVNDIIQKNIPQIIEPKEYISFNGFVALVLCPFVQGLFHGLGEGIARIYVGNWVGMAPHVALGARINKT
jgi:hypothetical protein